MKMIEDDDYLENDRIGTAGEESEFTTYCLKKQLVNEWTDIWIVREF